MTVTIRIQDRLREVAPDLLEWFEERAGDPVSIDATTGICDRCGCVVGLVAEPYYAHLEWHKSLTIGMDALAGMALLRRHQSFASLMRWLVKWIPRGRR